LAVYNIPYHYPLPFPHQTPSPGHNTSISPRDNAPGIATRGSNTRARGKG
jgi:hypothetical protein